MRIQKYRFGNNPDAAFEAGGILHGADSREVCEDDYESERAHALYLAMGATLDDEEMVLHRMSDGRLALVGCTVEGHPFAVETCDAVAKDENPGGGWITRTQAQQKYCCTEHFLRVAALRGDLDTRKQGNAYLMRDRDVLALTAQIPARLERAIRAHYAATGEWPTLSAATEPAEHERPEFLTETIAEMSAGSGKGSRLDRLEAYFLGQMTADDKREMELFEIAPDEDIDDEEDNA